MCDRARRDECVVRACRGLTPRCAQYRGDGAKCPRAITIERKNIKVRLGLLQVLFSRADARGRAGLPLTRAGLYEPLQALGLVEADSAQGGRR